MKRVSFRPCLFALSCLFCISISGSTAWAIHLGQVDDFQDGNTAGWFHAAPSLFPPTNAPDAGPQGVGDHALLVQAVGGGGPASRLIARNVLQWTGDFTAAGVSAIAMDLQNPNSVPLEMRIGLARIDDFGSWTGQYVSTQAITVPAANGSSEWRSVVFSLDASDMTHILGADSFADVLAHVGEIRLLHNPTPDWRGEVIEADFLADNFRAIPEPSTIAIVGLGLAGLGMLRLVRRK